MSTRSGNGTPPEDTGDDRIAIVGVGCRFPGGVRSLDAFGRLLSAGDHVFTDVPQERWGQERSAPGGGPGTISNGVGAFLDDIDRFDAAYFGVTPREANLLDPQQRLILEVAWEAMSDSGRPREEWRGTRTAVTFGLLAKDYELLHARTLGVDEIGQHHVSGLEFSFSAGRLAYTFDLRGPVSAVNSACSSSLLAVHQACQSLRADDCDTAIAGGVSLLVTPDISVFLSKVGAISPSGRCTPFDAKADGIVRGEGAGAVVLKRLADAVADQDRIYAVIRGSAANNDGTSLGLTVPNAVAQAELLSLALRRSGLAAADIDYVEAHGTGTAIGDMMEVEAIGEVYGAGRSDANPIQVGSHKALVGHMDAAAGIGGLLKSTWVVNSGLIPRQPYVERLNPAVDWRDGALSVPQAAIDLADRGRPARAGVSSFGLSGTNVHVIVEAPPVPTAPADGPATAGQPYVLLSSAAGAAGLAEQVAGVRELVDTAPDDALADLSAATTTRRTHEAHRFAVVAADREQALACLEDPEEPQDGAYGGVVPDPDSVPAPVFVFSGQGGQWPGMAMDLYESDPVVRDALEECAELIRAEASWSLLDHIRDADGSGGLERTEIVQPALFSVQVALTRWLAARGVRPGAIVGHSLGEVAAAHAAGVLTLPDAVRLIVRRSELLGEASGAGLMFAVQGDEPAVDAVLAETGLPVTVVAVNSPGGLIIAGPTDAVTDAAAALQDHGMRCRRLRVDAPAHSPVISHLGPRLQAALAGLDPARPTVRMLSTVDPDATDTVFDAAYWARNFTSPVRLWPAVDRLLAEDDHPLVEIGPHPVLVPSLAEAQRLRDRAAPALPVLNRYEAGPLAVHKALARLHVAGVPVDWEKVTGRPGRYRTLPVPSWEGGRYWLPGVRRGQQGVTDPRAAAAGGAALPARIRISLLDPNGAVTSEMYAEPTGAATGTPTGVAVTPVASGAPAAGPAPSPVAAAAGVPPVAVAVPVARRATGSRPGGAARVAEMTELITTTVRHLLGLPEGQAVARRRGLFEQGLDSLTAVALRTTLGEELGITLPTPIVFERPTIAALAEYLAEVAPAETAATAHVPEAADVPEAAIAAGTADVPAVPGSTPADDGIAVIGVSCRLPGAPSAEAFWDLLNNRTSTAADYPADRAQDPVWREVDAGLPLKGSYLHDIAAFDAPFFRISPREAKVIDPQQRLFLEVAWQALEDAGCPAHTLEEQPVGVYAGLSMADYQHLVARDMGSGGLNLYHGTGTSFAALAGRLSYVLGLRGPSMTVDTACSASLTAVHLACQALRTGDCEIAVVGGASAIVAPSPLIASMAASGALSADGRCKTFDENADGFGCGEGAVVMVLKPVSAALRDGDRVYAVLRGSAVNQDGATGGLTVPNGAAQVDVVRKAVARAGWAPHEVDYVEAHGTGTPLGDPIEVRALAESLGTGRGPDSPLLLGSAKANVGHLGAAAGAVGLLKVVLALRNGVLPPHLVEQPSTRIEWDSLPIELVAGARPWPAHGRPARAGVSAFGFSGSNAHVVVEQFVPAGGLAAEEGAPSGQDDAHLLVASAAGPEALREVLRRLADELRSAPERAADIVFTATHRRSLLEHRLAVPAASTAELVAALDAAAAGEPTAASAAGRVEDGEELVIGFRYGAETPTATTLARWAGYGPAYADTLAECARLLTELTGGPCDLTMEPAESLRAAHLFAHQAAATTLWRRLGVAPRAVTGAGAGRVTAAWADGRLTLAEALRVLTAGDLSGIDTDEDAVAGCDQVIDVLPAADSPFSLAAGLFAAGCRPIAPADGGHRHVSLPAYPWQHESYWYRDLSAAPVLPWVLSADDRDGLRGLADRLREFAATGQDPVGTGHALAARPGSAERLVVVGGGVGELSGGLVGFAGSGGGVNVVSGVVAGSVSAPVLVFPGQGWQWVGMGAELLGSSGVFAAVVGEISGVVEELAGWSVVEVLRDAGSGGGSGVGVEAFGRVDRVQPVMFAVMVGLARVWESVGVVPGAVVGHSQGEIAAACVAGVLSLRDAVRVVVARSAALVELAGTGCMVSVAASRERVEELLAARWPGRLWVAAVNGPGSVVVAGEVGAGDELVADGEELGVRVRRVPVDYASHTPLVEPVADGIRDALAGITPTAGRVPVYSTLTGGVVEGASMDAGYWYDNLRGEVRFADAVDHLLQDGFSVFVEASAHPVLTMGISDTVDQQPGRHATVTGTLRRDDGGTRRLLTSAATLWTTGTPLTWTTLLPPPPTTPTQLPATLWGDTPSREAAGASLAETRFWRMVERADGAELAGLLGVRGDDERASLEAFLPLLSQWRQTRRETETVNSWRYQVTWQPVADAPSGTLTGSWLVAVPEGMADHETVTACAKAISEHGGNPVVLPVDTTGNPVPADAFTADDGRPVAGVLSLLGLDESAHPQHPVVPAGLLATVRLYQAMEEAGCDARLWSVTSGAVAVADGEAAAHPAQAHLWGLNRVAGLENPQRLAGVVDLPADLDSHTTALLVTALAGVGDEDQLAVRDRALHARRLTPAPVADAPGEPWTPNGTILITGGTGALGSHVARWFSRRHADLVLTSRRGMAAPGATELREELLGLGAGSVTVTACDAADREALAALLADIPADRPLDAVIHTAGVVDDGPVNELSAESLENVLLPKTRAVQNLHDLTAGHDLSAFVLFSSAGSLLPNVGQAAYAAGNAYLDAFAAHRRAAGLPALSVAWGAWAGTGMAEEEGFVDWISRGGMDLMTPHLAVVALQQALDHADTNVAIANVDWERFAQRHNAARPNPLVAELVAPATAAATQSAGTDGLARLTGLPADRRADALLDSVIAELATVLGHSSTKGVRSDAAFKDLGIDSVTAIELRNRVTTVTGLRFSPIAVFDHPTSELLSEHLLTLLPSDGDDTDGAGSAEGPAREADEPDEPEEDGSRIDSMAIEDLVRMARGRNGS